MSSLSTKVNKSRSPVSSKVRATKGKKSASKKPQRPGKITAAPKSKKAASPKPKKPIANKKPVQSKKAVKAKPAKAIAKARPQAKQSKKPVQTRAAAKTRASVKATPPPPPKRQPTPGTLAAVRSFEQALKLFNRHDYQAARAAFEDISKKFSDQAEIIAGVRTYLSIIEQRLARTPSIPKNADALYNQGVFELNRGNIREAIDLFDKALRVEPRADHVLYSLASAYALLNDPAKALDALRRAIAIKNVHRSHARRDPDFTSLHENEDFQQLTGFGFEFAEE